jgi:hypothetical protein
LHRDLLQLEDRNISSNDIIFTIQETETDQAALLDKRIINFELCEFREMD